MAESYPAFRAGQKVTGELLASMLPQTVRKVSDTARTTETGADPELQFTVEANAVYTMEGTIYCSGTVLTDDINLDWSAPAGTDGTWSGIAADNDLDPASAANVTLLGTGITSARSFGTGTGGAAAPGVIAVTATIIVGSTAGTYSLDWNRLAGAGTVTVYSDSYLAFRRIS